MQNKTKTPIEVHTLVVVFQIFKGKRTKPSIVEQLPFEPADSTDNSQPDETPNFFDGAIPVIVYKEAIKGCVFFIFLLKHCVAIPKDLDFRISVLDIVSAMNFPKVEQEVLV